MSNNIEMKLKVLDLDALRRATEVRGLRFKEATTFRAHQPYRNEFGPCKYVLSVPNNRNAYEVGVTLQRDGSYKLVTDTWNGGYGLQPHIGPNGVDLMGEYEAQVFYTQMVNDGYTINETVDAEGNREIWAERS